MRCFTIPTSLPLSVAICTSLLLLAVAVLFFKAMLFYSIINACVCVCVGGTGGGRGNRSGTERSGKWTPTPRKEYVAARSEELAAVAPNANVRKVKVRLSLCTAIRIGNEVNDDPVTCRPCQQCHSMHLRP